jgi:hypothetical protein
MEKPTRSLTSTEPSNNYNFDNSHNTYKDTTLVKILHCNDDDSTAAAAAAAAEINKPTELEEVVIKLCRGCCLGLRVAAGAIVYNGKKKKIKKSENVSSECMKHALTYSFLYNKS